MRKTQIDLSIVTPNPKSISKLAIRALLYEVSVNPKPGLVDPTSNKTHPDMDVFTFIDSSIILEDYFDSCVEIALKNKNASPVELFQLIRHKGIKAEREMFTTTNGVNTHKGAIFSLGIMCTATAICLQKENNLHLSEIQQTIKAMLVDLLNNDLNSAVLNDKSLTEGEKQYIKFGKTGIRGEASNGFPAVFELSLPFFINSIGTLNERLIDTLILIAGSIQDSNLIKRSDDIEITNWMHLQMIEFQSLGGSKTQEGMVFLKQLIVKFNQRNLSLGGSADTLILTIFLALLFNQI